MAMYVYGIIDSNDKIDAFVTGLDGVGVYNIPYRDIGALASDLDTPVRDTDEERVLEHETVLEKMIECFTVLPMRFLTVFNEKNNVISMLNEHYNDFREDLDRLHDKTEFGIKVIWPGAVIREKIANAYSKAQVSVPSPDDSPGKSFVKKKFETYKINKEFEEEADRRIAVIDNFFNRNVCEKKLERLKTENMLLNASYLVDNEKQNDFKKAFEEMRAFAGDLKYLFSGPWPPYNFVTKTNTRHDRE